MYRASVDKEEGVQQARTTPRECKELYIVRIRRKNEMKRSGVGNRASFPAELLGLTKEETRLWKSDCLPFRV